MIEDAPECGQRQNAVETPLRGVERNDVPDLLPATVVGRDTPNCGPMPEGVVCTLSYAVGCKEVCPNRLTSTPLLGAVRQGSAGTMTPAPDPTDANAPR